jgi:hypothetical protein
MEKNAARIIELYLDYLNNYLTVERFAEAYGMNEDNAKELLACGRYIGNFDEGNIRNYANDR